MSSTFNKLSAAAEERKIRLAALRNLKRKQPDDEIAPPESERTSPKQDEETDVTQQILSGRNYDFETRGPKLGFETMPNEGLEKPTLEEQAAEVEAQIKHEAAEEAQDDKGLDLFKLQPKKPNWDLRRNLDQKLETLNVRTENAIARLVRERIQSSQKAIGKGKAPQNGTADAEIASVDGSDLVQKLRAREKEVEEDEKREREDYEAITA